METISIEVTRNYLLITTCILFTWIILHVFDNLIHMALKLFTKGDIKI